MSPPAAPRSICLLRLSALGDATHVVPLIRTLRRAWPEVPITWILGKGEAKLMEGLEGVELIVFDKGAGARGVAALRKSLAGRRFDVLLQMQLALRANLLSALVRANRRVGYDVARSKEGHSLFINERISAAGHHVLDAFGKFCEPLGLRQDRVEWNLPVPDSARAWAAEQLPGDQPTLIVSPCSSHTLRNWRADRYAAVADHAAERGWRIAICGGRSELERRTGDEILRAMRHPAIDLIGKDTLKQLLALLERATLVLSPDSGPAHMANAMGTKVIGLFACTDRERCGPYSDLRWSVNHYDEASRKFMGKPAGDLRWGKRVEFPGVMDLISVEEVTGIFDAFIADAARDQAAGVEPAR
ncbi:MAG: ADP-heptose--LPS heptosyltransferase [Gammaproteobacteria bacterium RIFCSPHIGHO2_12_FULL_63_22]|nr:MAG: ADP-heptose--LPS heptosyltransferase [Gammaproteobacteria bacterium RIFCSPHIGHO2_12_FULL_63_22]